MSRQADGPYKARKHPKPTPMKRWVCMDMRDKSIVSEHYRRANAVDVARLSNSIARKYGSIHT